MCSIFNENLIRATKSIFSLKKKHSRCSLFCATKNEMKTICNTTDWITKIIVINRLDCIRLKWMLKAFDNNNKKSNSDYSVERLNFRSHSMVFLCLPFFWCLNSFELKIWYDWKCTFLQCLYWRFNEIFHIFYINPISLCMCTFTIAAAPWIKVSVIRTKFI